MLAALPTMPTQGAIVRPLNLREAYLGRPRKHPYVQDDGDDDGADEDRQGYLRRDVPGDGEHCAGYG